MKRIILIIALVSLTNPLLSQIATYYTNDKGQRHLCGPFEVQVLETDSTYQKWFKSRYNEFIPGIQKAKWAKNLSDVEVDIYLGTWCGDSKKWVPKFVKIWDELGLDRSQLFTIGLYDSQDGKSVYKQGPNGEEKGRNIHRVPTFIFKREGKEIARIVEYPNNDLETDLAQIALGFPSRSNYRGAAYMLDLFQNSKMSEIEANKTEHFYAVYRLIKGNPSELNTLGYVLLEAGKIEEALLVFYFNTRYFQHNPNVHDSYAEALVKDGQIEKAIETYEKVLLLDRNNANASQQIEKLKT
ncbi:MAG: hypothetical protein AAGH46_08365 [Bacteroidota bacterium]